MLFVFALAAAVAFLLYLEVPRVAFEAQRAKEETLIARGEQYQRAIQLYIRKNNQYPPTIDALEKSTTVRFLRRRYKDPMTGKDEWKLIQIGANGVLLNSLTQKPPETEQAKGKEGSGTSGDATAAGGQPAPAWAGRQRPSDMRAGSQGPGQLPGTDYPAPADPQLTQYPPPVAPGQQPYPQPGGYPQLAGQPPYGYAQQPGLQPYNPQQPGQPPAPGQPVYFVAGQQVPGQVLQPGQQPYVYPPVQPGQQPNVVTVQPGQPGYPQFPQGQPYPGQQQYPQPGQPYPQPGQVYPAGPQPYPYNPQPYVPGQPYPRPGLQPGAYPGPPVSSQTGGVSPTPYPTQNYQQQYQQYPYSTQPGQAGAPAGQSPFFSPPTGQQTQNPAANMIMQQLTNPRPGGLSGFPQQPGGQIMGGGIAGVASTVEAEGIKVYNEKSKYNEWEFIYDPKKDRARMGQLGMPPGNLGQQPQQPSVPVPKRRR